MFGSEDILYCGDEDKTRKLLGEGSGIQAPIDARYEIVRLIDWARSPYVSNSHPFPILRPW